MNILVNFYVNRKGEQKRGSDYITRSYLDGEERYYASFGYRRIFILRIHLK